MSTFPFHTIPWHTIPVTEHPGETGTAFWQTHQLDGLRIRLVRYSAGYLADHWCSKGHIVHCLEGELISELANGNKQVLTPGSTYVVSDQHSQHRSFSSAGARLLIIDGDFLRNDA